MHRDRRPVGRVRRQRWRPEREGSGVVIRDGHLWVDYYTSRIDRDWPWVFGMPLQTNIHLAKIPLDALREVSTTTP